MNVAGVRDGSDVRYHQINVGIVCRFSRTDSVARSQGQRQSSDVGRFRGQCVGDAAGTVQVAVGSDDDRARCVSVHSFKFDVPCRGQRDRAASRLNGVLVRAAFQDVGGAASECQCRSEIEHSPGVNRDRTGPARGDSRCRAEVNVFVTDDQNVAASR